MSNIYIICFGNVAPYLDQEDEIHQDLLLKLEELNADIPEEAQVFTEVIVVE